MQNWHQSTIHRQLLHAVYFILKRQFFCFATGSGCSIHLITGEVAWFAGINCFNCGCYNPGWYQLRIIILLPNRSKFGYFQYPLPH
jgi:hypothetical protein